MNLKLILPLGSLIVAALTISALLLSHVKTGKMNSAKLLSSLAPLCGAASLQVSGKSSGASVVVSRGARFGSRTRSGAGSPSGRAAGSPSAGRLLNSSYPQAQLTLYDGPKTMRTSTQTQVKVNGRPLFIYETHVNNTHSWASDGNPPLESTPVAYFDLKGTAVIEVTLPGTAVSSAKVTPAADGIRPQVSGNTVRFTIRTTGAYTVEFNGSVERALHLFVNPIETNLPNRNDPHTVYIGPGEWDMGEIQLQNNETLYLAGGAVLHGTVLGENVSHVTVRGRGILDGSKNPGWMLNGNRAFVPIDFRNCQDVKVEGISILDPNAWSFNSYETENANIENVKIISARPNGDGFTFQSCRNFTVKNCFVRTWDDSLVLKNYGGSTDSVTFDGIQVWTDLAQSCEIGYETNKGNEANPEITHITFQNITVLHNFHKPVLSIHNSDNALVSDITYRNIVVEDAEMGQGDAGNNNQLIDLSIAPSAWSSTSERGKIRNVTFDGITVLGGKFPPSRLQGYDAAHCIENVRIAHCTILGRAVHSAGAGAFTVNSFVKNVVFS